MMMFNNLFKDNAYGFTMVEMLVVLGIFSGILAGVLKVFDTTNYTYKVQEEVAAMQQNVRVSKMFLERDIRMAGCGIGEDFNFHGSRIYAISIRCRRGLHKWSSR